MNQVSYIPKSFEVSQLYHGSAELGPPKPLNNVYVLAAIFEKRVDCLGGTHIPPEFVELFKSNQVKCAHLARLDSSSDWIKSLPYAQYLLTGIELHSGERQLINYPELVTRTHKLRLLCVAAAAGVTTSIFHGSTLGVLVATICACYSWQQLNSSPIQYTHFSS